MPDFDNEILHIESIFMSYKCGILNWIWPKILLIDILYAVEYYQTYMQHAFPCLFITDEDDCRNCNKNDNVSQYSVKNPLSANVALI